MWPKISNWVTYLAGNLFCVWLAGYADIVTGSWNCFRRAFATEWNSSDSKNANATVQSLHVTHICVTLTADCASWHNAEKHNTWKLPAMWPTVARLEFLTTTQKKRLRERDALRREKTPAWHAEMVFTDVMWQVIALLFKREYGGTHNCHKAWKKGKMIYCCTVWMGVRGTFCRKEKRWRIGKYTTGTEMKFGEFFQFEQTFSI